ncbi:MAG: hypothetical protein ACLFQB_15140 [Chitinispirillaceae bacterium]
MKSRYLLILCLITSVVFAREAKPYFVKADVVNVREKPDAEASIVGRLRVGNYFWASQKNEGWARIDSVHVRHYGGNSTLDGWVFLRACSKERVDLKMINRQLRSAKTLKDSIKWCERRAALKPDEKKYWEELKKFYAAAEDTGRAKAVGQKLRGTDPTFLAHMIEGRCYLLGAIDSTGDFRRLSWKQTYDPYAKNEKWTIHNDSDKVRKKELENLRVSLAGIVWYRKNSTYAFQLISPEIAPDENYDPAYNGKDRYYADIDGTITFRLNLGEIPGTEDHTIIASKPFEEIRSEGIRGKKDLALLGRYRKALADTFYNRNGLQGIHYSSIPEYGYTDVVLHGYIRGSWYLTLRGIFDSKGKQVWPSGDENYHKREFESASCWFRFGKDNSSPAFSVIPYTDSFQKPYFEKHNGNFGYQVVRMGKDGVKVFYATREYAGD